MKMTFYLGMAGVGGVILFPNEMIELTFPWDLGMRSNNQVEAYALLKGLQLTNKQI